MSRAAVLLLLLLLLLTGCVERKMLIRSDPPGARVYLNRSLESAGITPLAMDFDHYGTWLVRLEHEDRSPLEVEVPVEAPWWSYPGLDLVTELLLPVTIRDEKDFHFVLPELPPPPTTTELERRASELRERALRFEDRMSREGPEEIR